MKQSARMAAAVFVLVLLAVAPAGAQDTMEFVDNSVFSDPRRPRAVFVHEEHNDAAGIDDCTECHHVYEDGRKLEDESSEDSRCADCHGMEDSGNQPGLAKAFHLNCKQCHLKEKKGPIMCGQCHRKP